MSQAYQQLLLDEESRKYAVINMHRGLFRYNRLPFGISSAPDFPKSDGVHPQWYSRCNRLHWWCPSDWKVWRGAPVCAGGSPPQDHGIWTQTEERQVCVSGSICCVSGTSDWLRGPAPHCRKSRSSAGSTSSKERLRVEVLSRAADLLYYSRFLPNLSSELAPLHKLLKHNEPWHWTSRQKKAFERSKELLLSSQLLVHFDPNLEIHLACDASSYGIGAVLSHKCQMGLRNPWDLYPVRWQMMKRSILKLRKRG